MPTHFNSSAVAMLAVSAAIMSGRAFDGASSFNMGRKSRSEIPFHNLPPHEQHAMPRFRSHRRRVKKFAGKKLRYSARAASHSPR